MEKIENVKFDDFAEFYCGTSDINEQKQELLDSLMNSDYESIIEDELSELYGKTCTIGQSYFEENDYYDITIYYNNKVYVCASLNKFEYSRTNENED